MEKRNTRLARYLKRFLPKKERAFVDLWIRVHRNPKRYLRDPRLKSTSAHARRIVAHGITRRARRDPDAAYEWFEGFRKAKVLSLKQVQDLRYRIALEAASDGLPLAHSLMEATPPYLHDDTFRHMRLRLALHERDWHKILKAAKELPDAYPYNQMSPYWQARALKQLGRTAESIELFQQIALQRGFYGFLAAERLNQPHSLNNAPVQLKENPAKRSPALERAREFYHHGSVMNAREEWYDLLAQDDKELLNHAAVAANSWGWHEGTIRAFGKSRYFDDLKRRFPRVHADLFEKEARRNGVDSSVLFAISRRESAFAADTRSRAGAVGLMQLMPATARQVARSLKLKRPRTQSLKKPNLNNPPGQPLHRRHAQALRRQSRHGPGRLQRRPRSRRPLASGGRDGCGHLDRHHPVRGNPPIRPDRAGVCRHLPMASRSSDLADLAADPAHTPTSLSPRTGQSPAYFAACNAWSISSRMSSMCSMPIDSRTMSGVTPAAFMEISSG